MGFSFSKRVIFVMPLIFKCTGLAAISVSTVIFLPSSLTSKMPESKIVCFLFSTKKWSQLGLELKHYLEWYLKLLLISLITPSSQGVRVVDNLKTFPPADLIVHKLNDALAARKFNFEADFLALEAIQSLQNISTILLDPLHHLDILMSRSETCAFLSQLVSSLPVLQKLTLTVPNWELLHIEDPLDTFIQSRHPSSFPMSIPCETYIVHFNLVCI
jgi:hypothetical protein